MITGGSSLPAFISFDSSLKKFTVNTAEANLADTTISITVTVTAQTGVLTG